MKNIGIIINNELRLIVRDKTTILMLLIPIICIPLLGLGLNYINKTDNRISFIYIENGLAERVPEIKQYFEQKDQYVILTSRDKTNIKNKIITEVALNNRNVIFKYHTNNFNSLYQAIKVKEDIEKYYYRVNSSKDYVFNIVNQNGTNEMEMAKSVFDMIAPLLLIIFAIKSNKAIINDLFVGEKERKTLELLFLSGAKRQEIYWGKVLTVMILNECGFIIMLFSYFMSSSGIYGEFNIEYELFVLLLILSFEFLFISITVSIAVSKTRNAQTVNEMIDIIPISLEMLFVAGIIHSDNMAFRYIPVLNLILSINKAHLGIIQVGELLMSIIINLLAMLFFVWIGLRLMCSEKILLDNN